MKIFLIYGVAMFICRLTKYDKEDYAKIGVMPHYVDVDLVLWMEPECTSHTIGKHFYCYLFYSSIK